MNPSHAQECVAVEERFCSRRVPYNRNSLKHQGGSTLSNSFSPPSPRTRALQHRKAVEVVARNRLLRVFCADPSMKGSENPTPVAPRDVLRVAPIVEFVGRDEPIGNALRD